MPLREFECPEHGRFEELITGDYPQHAYCPICNFFAPFVFSSATFRVTFQEGWDPGAGKYFDTPRERANFLAENNLEPVPDGVYGRAGADIRR